MTGVVVRRHAVRVVVRIVPTAVASTIEPANRVLLCQRYDDRRVVAQRHLCHGPSFTTSQVPGLAPGLPSLHISVSAESRPRSRIRPA